jgi:hypothetical protein
MTSTTAIKLSNRRLAHNQKDAFTPMLDGGRESLCRYQRSERSPILVENNQPETTAITVGS